MTVAEGFLHRGGQQWLIVCVDEDVEHSTDAVFSPGR